MSDLQKTLEDAIRATLSDPDGAGSDLNRCEQLDSTWTYVEGNLDVEHLASEVIHVLDLDYEYASRYIPDPSRPHLYFQSAWGLRRRAIQNIEDSADANTVLVRRVKPGKEEVVD